MPSLRSDLRNEAAFTRGPIEKFLHNRRIPYKLITNVLMVVLLACLTEVYVVPIRSALGNERHAMTETLLSLGRGEDAAASYESKWHGDYVEMPRIMVASLEALQRHVVHVLRTVDRLSLSTSGSSREGTDRNTSLSSGSSVVTEVTFVEAAVQLPTNDPMARLLGNTFVWGTEPSSYRRRGASVSGNGSGCNDEGFLDVGRALVHVLRESQQADIVRCLNASDAPRPCSDPVPPAARCSAGGGGSMACAPCAPLRWQALLDGSASCRAAAIDVWGMHRMLQLMSSLHLQASWSESATTWKVANNGVAVADDVEGDASLTRSWRVDVWWLWEPTARTLISATANVRCDTRRNGFLSSDNELSPDDGVLVVVLLFVVVCMSVADALLRCRALRAIERSHRSDALGTRTASIADITDDSDTDAATHWATTRDAEGRCATSNDVDANDDECGSDVEEGSTMLRETTHRGTTSTALPPSSRNAADNHASAWTSFLLKGKGRRWHLGALLSDGLALLFGLIGFVERSGQAVMTHAWWTALQFALASAVFGHCIGLVGFLRFTPRAYMLVRATRRAMGRLMLLIGGVLPLYCGFAMLLYVAFGANSAGEFDSFGSACLALVFMMFGDNLLPAFRKIDGSRHWWMRAAADTIGCLYVALFMSVVLNVAIATVVDTYKDVSREAHMVLLLDNSAPVASSLESQDKRRKRVALIRLLKREIREQLVMLDAVQQADANQSPPAV